MTSSNSSKVDNLWINITPLQLKENLLQKYSKGTKNQAKIVEFITIVFAEIEKAGFANYASLQELDWDVGIRAHTMYAMDEINTSVDAEGERKFSYAQSTSEFSTHSNFWQKRPLKIQQVTGTLATEALNDLFEKGARLDCERSADACVLRGVAKAFACNNPPGKKDYSEKFDALYQKEGLQLKTSFGMREGQLISKIPTKLAAYSLLPGDRRYYTNLPDYLMFNPGGFASGEHCICVGASDKKELVYQAIELKRPLTEAQMFEFLAENYDYKHAGFINFLYEKLGSPEFKPWSDFFPKVQDNYIQSFKSICESAFQAYARVEAINPDSIKNKNLKQHLYGLTSYYTDILCGQIAQQNEGNQHKYIRRIDVPKLLEIAKVISPKSIQEQSNNMR